MSIQTTSTHVGEKRTIIDTNIIYQNMAWIKVCDANSLSNGDLIGFDYSNKKILITKAQDKIYATDGICTHEYADLFNRVPK